MLARGQNEGKIKSTNVHRVGDFDFIKNKVHILLLGYNSLHGDCFSYFIFYRKRDLSVVCVGDVVS